VSYSCGSSVRPLTEVFAEVLRHTELLSSAEASGVFEARHLAEAAGVAPSQSSGAASLTDLSNVAPLRDFKR